MEFECLADIHRAAGRRRRSDSAEYLLHNIGQRRAGCFIDDDFINPARRVDVKTRRHFAIAERVFGRRVFCNFAVKRAEKFAFGHNRRGGSRRS